MLNRMLPHAVTYYHRVRPDEGEEGCEFERSVLFPVRVQCDRIEEGEVWLETAALYIFPEDLPMPLPTLHPGDFFVSGKCSDPLPPEDGSAYLVKCVVPVMGVDRIKFYRVDADGNGGGWDD